MRQIAALGILGAFMAVAACSNVQSQPSLLFPSREITGEYYLGDGLGVNCSLTLVEGRFNFKWTGCLGVYDSNTGTWVLQGDIVLLKPEKPNKCEGFKGMNLRFIPVKWGQRHYLIDENEMPGFCAAIRRMQLPHMRGQDYVKLDGGKLPPGGGDLAIPERYRKYYESGAITGVVASVKADGLVVLNVGTQQTVRPGLLLAARGHKRIDLEVVSVSGEEVTAKTFYFWNSDRLVAPADVFTTGDYFCRPRGTGHERLTSPPKGGSKTHVESREQEPSMASKGTGT